MKTKCLVDHVLILSSELLQDDFCVLVNDAVIFESLINQEL